MDMYSLSSDISCDQTCRLMSVHWFFFFFILGASVEIFEYERAFSKTDNMEKWTYTKIYLSESFR